LFDEKDARLLIQTTVVLVAGSSTVLTIATVLGLAVRFFHMAAGG
jgi:hypothetical protein